MHMQDENPNTTKIVRPDAEASSTAALVHALANLVNEAERVCDGRRNTTSDPYPALSRAIGVARNVVAGAGQRP